MLPPPDSLPVLQMLVVHYLNERGTNRILRAHPEVVEQVLFLLEVQKEKMRAPDTPVSHRHVYSIEVERTEWILAEYLNLRLKKLRNSYYAVETDLLTGEEREYLRAYLRLHEKSGILLEEEKIPSRLLKKRPEHAGFYILSGETRLEVGTEEIAAEPGDFFIADISGFADLLADAKILLI